MLYINTRRHLQRNSNSVNTELRARIDPRRIRSNTPPQTHLRAQNTDMRAHGVQKTVSPPRLVDIGGREIKGVDDLARDRDAGGVGECGSFGGLGDDCGVEVVCVADVVGGAGGEADGLVQGGDVVVGGWGE